MRRASSFVGIAAGVALTAVAAARCTPFDAAEHGDEDAVLGHDGAGDGGTGDGGLVTPDAGALLGRRCADFPDAAFCDDFDQPGASGYLPWAGQTGTNGSSERTSLTSTSAPSSLRSTGNPTTTNPAKAAFEKDFTVQAERVQLGFDLRVETTGPKAGFVTYVSYLTTAKQYYLQVILDGGDVLIGEDAQGGGEAEVSSSKHCFNLPPNAWAHLDFGVDLSVPVATLRLNGGAECRYDLLYVARMEKPFKLELQIGLPYVDRQDGGFVVEHDSVIFETP